MPESFFRRVVVPSLINGSSLLCITTLGTEDNFVGRMIQKKNTKGKPLFNVIVKDEVCDECKRTGKALECSHKKGEKPYWHKVDRQEDVKAMMEDSVDDYLRESKGIQSNSLSSPAFDSRSVIKLLEKESLYSKQPPDARHVFVTYDPACGGAKSRCAVTSSIYIGATMLVSILVV
jgi:hypothetical protein